MFFLLAFQSGLTNETERERTNANAGEQESEVVVAVLRIAEKESEQAEREKEKSEKALTTKKCVVDCNCKAQFRAERKTKNEKQK